MACSNAMFNPVQLFQNPILGYNHAFFSGVVPVFFFALAGRLLPNEPLKIFPFLVFLSPLPMMVFLNEVQTSEKKPIKKALRIAGLFNRALSQAY
jgi:hypothetical protein